MKKLRFFSSAVLFATVLSQHAPAQNLGFFTPMTSFGRNGDGSIRPGDELYVTTGNAQRGMAYNSAWGRVILVDRATGNAGSGVTGGIYILDGLNGQAIWTLSTNGISGGNYATFAVAVDDAGVVYVGNLVNDGTASPFKLYRWEFDTTSSGPVLVYSGDPGNGRPQRWGDTMDIRGSGASTQIILGSRNAGAAFGTNVAILTTSDGINFTATTIATDASDNATAGGISFGTGDTFWAKDLNTPLRQFSFDFFSGTATTLHSYGPDVLAASRNLEALTVDTQANLLAIGDFTSGVDHVRLYDTSFSPPALLDVKDFPVNNANATTTKGYLDIAFGVLYVHNINNGLLGFYVDSTLPAAPQIKSQPTSQRVIAGRNVSLEVLAYPATSYQWQRDGADIPGANNSVLTLNNIQTTDAGTYRVIVSNSGGNTISSDAILSVVRPEDVYHLNLLWSAAPGAAPYVTSSGGTGTPNERSFGYNALSNHVYIVQKSGNNYTVHVINGSTGAKLYNLKTNGILPVVMSEIGGANGVGLVAIDVADDGAIYACNESPNAGGGITFATGKLFRAYRWADGDSNTIPVQIFQGDPAAQTANFRWGDVLDVRGGGLNTQILLDNQNTSARFMAILRPTDASMTAFVSTYFTQDTTTPFGTSIGRSLEFGSGDTFWQKHRSAALLQSSFDLTATDPRISPNLATYGNFLSTLGPVSIDLSRNLLAGINFASVATDPDKLALYDVSDLQNPVLLAQYSFPQTPRAVNANSIGRVLFAGNKLFALDGNNGMLAFTVASGPTTPPTILRQPQPLRVVSGGSATLSVVTADLATYQWQHDNIDMPGANSSSYTIVNAQPEDAGSYRVIVSNDAGSTTSSITTVAVLPADNFYRLSASWSIPHQTRDYLRNDTDGQGRTPLYRSIGYNTLSNQVYLVARSNQTSLLGVYVLNADTGEDLYQLNTNGIAGGGIVLLGIDVADDGAIYAANMADLLSGPTQTFNLYRWANSDPTTPPVLVYSGDPGAALGTAARWGDTLEVRGSGTDTEIIVDANSGTMAAVFKPADPLMASFTASTFTQGYGSGSIGRSLQFSSGNTFWQKRKGDRLQLSGYDLSAGSTTVLTNYPNFANSLGPVAVEASRKLVLGINFAATRTVPDTVDLYDVADFNSPLLVASYSFPSNSRLNGNFIGQVVIAGNRIFAVDGNNGLAAFTLVAPSGPPVTIDRSGANIVIAWPSTAAGFVLQKTTSLSSPNWTDVATPVVPMDDQNTVTESAASGNAFYRLHKGN